MEECFRAPNSSRKHASYLELTRSCNFKPALATILEHISEAKELLLCILQLMEPFALKVFPKNKSFSCIV
jgi:hypothetical protein